MENNIKFIIPILKFIDKELITEFVKNYNGIMKSYYIGDVACYYDKGIDADSPYNVVIWYKKDHKPLVCINGYRIKNSFTNMSALFKIYSETNKMVSIFYDTHNDIEIKSYRAYKKFFEDNHINVIDYNNRKVIEDKISSELINNPHDDEPLKFYDNNYKPEEMSIDDRKLKAIEIIKNISKGRKTISIDKAISIIEKL